MRTRRPVPARHRATRSLASLALALALAGCGGSGSESGDSLNIIDPWVKSAEGGMTAAFATLENPTGEDLAVVAATSDAAASVELHEVVDGVMQERDGGFTIPAGGTTVLQPGGLHLMLMGLTAAVEPGQEVALTLELSTCATVEVTATAKDFDGADEEYDEAGASASASPAAS